MSYSTFEPFREREGIAGMGGSSVNKQASPDSLFAELTTKESFIGLDGASYGDDKPIDKFSGTRGDINCDGISSGLTNSKGGLCLNDIQTQLLRTRGGNASGGDSQIGQ